MSPGRRDQVGDPLDAGEQHLIRCGERLEHADAAIADLEQPVVRHDDEGVHLVLEVEHPDLGLGGAPLAFETEWLGHHADGECADRLGDARDHGRAAGAGPAALACRDEDHVCAGEGLLDLLGVVLGGTAADLRVRAGAEPAGELAPDVELHIGVAHEQCLRVGVDRDELDPAQAELDHAVDGVHATATDADHLDDGEVVLVGRHFEAPHSRPQQPSTSA